MKIKKAFLFLLAFSSCFVLAACAANTVQDLPDKIDVYFFHDTACGSCDGTEEFMELFANTLGDVREENPYQIHTYNVFQTAGREKYESLTQTMGIPTDGLDFPLLIVGGKAFSGMESIQKNLREAFLTASEDLFVYQSPYMPSQKKETENPFEDITVPADSSTFVYFYRITCDECIQTGEFLDTLPSSIEANGVTSELEMIRFNTRSGENGLRISTFFEAYQVPPEDQMVPIVFLRDRYLAGYDAISQNLLDALENGDGTGFSFP